MQRCLHPDLVKRTLQYDPQRDAWSLRYPTDAARMLALTQEGGGSDLPEPERTYTIEVLGAFRHIASAAVLSHDFMDYLHLACLDGRWLIVADRESAGQPLGLFAFSLESGERRRLTSPPAEASGDSAPAVSPDGRTLVFVRSFAPGVSELQRLALSADLAPSGASAQRDRPGFLRSPEVLLPRLRVPRLPFLRLPRERHGQARPPRER